MLPRDMRPDGPDPDHQTTWAVVYRNGKRMLRVAVAVVLLYLVVSYTGYRMILAALDGADVSVLWLAFLVTVVAQYLVAWRLKRLTDVQDLSQSTMLVFEINLATRFYGLFLPGGNVTALLIRIFKFTRERSQIAGVVVSLFIDRVTATLTLCVLGLIFWILVSPRPDNLWLLVFALTTLAGLVLTWMLFSPSFSPSSGLMAKLVLKLGLRLRGKLSYIFQRSRRAGGRVLVNSLALSVVAHLVGTVGYWLVAQSLDMQLSLLVLGWIRAGMMLVALLPITIAGLGVREVTALVLLRQFGVESEVAIAFSILIFTATVLGIGLLGGLTEAWRFAIAKSGGR